MNNDMLQLQLLIDSRKVKTNHVLHLILSLCTLWLWSIVWICVAVSNSYKNERMAKDLTAAWLSDNGKI